MYEASGSCIGLPQLRAGSYIDVAGVGKRFSGRYRLTRVSHTLDHAGYRTEFEVTQRAGSSVLGLLRKTMIDQPPPDRREPVTGVAVGVVRTVDPVRYRVGVHLPQLGDLDTVDAGCATVMAGSGRGVSFLPEIDDQVLVAFAGGDLTQPYVLGSLWSQRDVKPTLGQPGVQRIKSRAGHTISMDDTASRLVIEHPTGTSITLDADGSVVIDAVRDIELNAPTGEIRLSARDVKVAVAGTMDVGKAI
jgi:uncharacterized protein involved in type VI secretion and phage assembly